MTTRSALANGASAANMQSKFDSELEESFARYARIDTQSDEKSTTSPSTKKQYDLLNLLLAELKSIGAQDVRLTSYGAVIATIPSTVKATVPTIAFLAHVDTAPAFTDSSAIPGLP